MTTFQTRPGVVEVISKAAAGDEGTLDFIVDALLYEALCDEIDLQRPWLEKDARAIIGKQASNALESLAKAYADTSDEPTRVELAKRAEQLYAVVEVSKENNPEVDDAAFNARVKRDEGGRFSRQVLDALKLFTGGGKDGGGENRKEAGRSLDQIAGGDRYSRARALGGALKKVPDGNTQAVGRLASVIGEVGPEAERVFGRGLTRLSYRYRGTERRAPEDLRRAIQGQLAGRKALVNRTDNGAGRPAANAELADIQRLGIAGNQASLYLSGKVADLDLAKLSLEAGQLPPSRGVIIDAGGNPVSESVGVNGDHYLPFDLKNLKRLQGGQYVRTRVTGGLTDEDIYTGLLSGARQVQVVSNSGVFTVEFDPSLRGGRRYSDKARQMVKRYAAIVERVGSGQVTAQDLPPKAQAQIRQRAFDRAGGNATLATQYAEADLEKARFAARFQEKDDEQLWAEASEIARSQMTSQMQRMGNKGADSSRALGQAQKEVFNSLKAEQRENTVREYRLDAEGYEAAQKALQQEFPFFIRQSNFEELGDFLARNNALPETGRPRRPGRDIGYTPRGELEQGAQGARSRQAQAERRGAPAPTEDTRPAAEQGAKPAAAAPSAAPSSAGLVNVQRSMTNALSAPLQVLAAVGYGDGFPEPELSDGPENGKGYTGEQYLKWLVEGYASGDANKITALLLDPKTDNLHRTKLVQALKQLQKTGANAPLVEDIEPAIALVEVSGQIAKPFADPADRLHSADPTKGPQPVAEIAAAYGDIDKLLAYAEGNPEVTAQAQLILDEGEEGYVKRLTSMSERNRMLMSWPKVDGQINPARVPTGAKPEDAEEAALLAGADDDHPLLAPAIEAHKGFALARAIRLTAALNGEEVPKLPFGKAARRRPLGSRVPVIKVHGPSSPAARALAARRRL